MFAAYRNPATAYRQVEVETSLDVADPHKLIAMLFEGAISAIQRAVSAIASGDVQAKVEAITRALRIVDEGLKASLDPSGGLLTVRLNDLYMYISGRLLTGSVRNDVDALNEACALLVQLRDAWVQIAPARPATAS